MRPPLLPIADTTDRYRLYVNVTAAPEVPVWHPGTASSSRRQTGVLHFFRYCNTSHAL